MSSVPSHELGRNVINALLDTTKVAPEDISEVILGQVLTCGQGQNPARQASINAGLPDTVPAMGVSMVCGSGLRSVALAAQSIRTGDASIIIAGMKVCTDICIFSMVAVRIVISKDHTLSSNQYLAIF